MNAQEKVYKRLNALEIKYEVTHHPPVFTIDEMECLKLPYSDVCKNLFLRDAKGKKHFLVVLSKNKKANLKSIQEQLGTTNLSFASEKRLNKYLQLRKGEVTPFGILNDRECEVEVVMDKELKDKTKLGVHPNDNRATVWIAFSDLKRVIEENGNIINYATI